jgi:hypothetical protein
VFVHSKKATDFDNNGATTFDKVFLFDNNGATTFDKVFLFDNNGATTFDKELCSTTTARHSCQSTSVHFGASSSTQHDPSIRYLLAVQCNFQHLADLRQ